MSSIRIPAYFFTIFFFFGWVPDAICASDDLRCLTSDSLLQGHILSVSAIRDVEIKINCAQQLKTGMSGLNITSEPRWGKVRFENQTVLVYKAKRENCQETEMLLGKYVDTSGQVNYFELHIDIRCEPITVLGGFQPDGTEDPTTFTVIGAEQFPNNTLSIFDHKGAEIFKRKGYRNDWDGRSSAVAIKPGYVYYYLFEDGEGGTYTGTFHIDQ